MMIAVLSDTHNAYPLAKQAMLLCREMKVDRILHCGDICNVEMVDILSELPTDYVYGNCDGAKVTLAKRIEETGGVIHGRFGHVEWEGKKIAFLHGDNDTRLDQECRCGNWDLVCYGHTHRHMLCQVGPTVILNPGAFQRRYDGVGFCMVRLPELEVIRIPLE